MNDNKNNIPEETTESAEFMRPILTPDEPEEDVIEQIVTLYDEEGNPEDYELIDLFEFQDNIYGAFTPVLTADEPTEIDVVMLKVTEDGNAFAEIEDPTEEEAAFRELLRREDEEFD